MAEAVNSRVRGGRVLDGDSLDSDRLASVAEEIVVATDDKSSAPLDPRGSHWRRSLIVWPDGRRDDTSAVDWLQGPTLYIDLRCPADRPDFATTPRLDDLGWNAVTWLARQEGFAGRLQFDGECFEWERVIDYQPKSVAPDIGRLWLENGVMIEQGRDIPYVEHWHRQDGARAPCAAVRLRQQGQDSEGFIVRLGQTFMYARARTVATQAGLSLSECVTRARSLTDARALIDCEISIGRIEPSGWIITRSTLPFRERQQLTIAAPVSRERLRTTDIAASGDVTVRDWDILEAEGDVQAIVPPVG
jgi:hypothetical protein